MDRKILDRYNSPGGAASYATKFTRRWTERIGNWHEQRLLRKLLSRISRGERFAWALDLPCGYGRLYPQIRRFARRVLEADWSAPLLDVARKRQAETSNGLPADGYVRATALSLPFADRTFDLVLSVRLSHHIRDRAERIAHIRELLRVSRGYVLFTYFDQDSWKNRMRELRRRFQPKRAKWALRRAEVRSVCRQAGFDEVGSFPLVRVLSGHRYEVVRRAL